MADPSGLSYVEAQLLVKRLERNALDSQIASLEAVLGGGGSSSTTPPPSKAPDSAIVCKKRKQPTKKKDDGDEPKKKRPQTGYQLFCREYLAHNAKSGIKEWAEAWQKLDTKEKSEWVAKAALLADAVIASSSSSSSSSSAPAAASAAVVPSSSSSSSSSPTSALLLPPPNDDNDDDDDDYDGDFDYSLIDVDSLVLSFQQPSTTKPVPAVPPPPPPPFQAPAANPPPRPVSAPLVHHGQFPRPLPAKMI